MRTQDESPFNRASVLLRHASLWVCCLPSPVLKYQHPGHPSLRPQWSKSALRKYVLAPRVVLSLPSGDHGNARIPRVRSAIFPTEESSGRSPHVFFFIADRCLVTTTASDDEFSIEYSRIESWVQTSLLLLVWQACTSSSLQNPRIGVLSLRPCGPVCRRLSVTADVASVHQIRSELHPPQYPCIRRDLDASQYDAPMEFPVLWPDHPRVQPCVR